MQEPITDLRALAKEVDAAYGRYAETEDSRLRDELFHAYVSSNQACIEKIIQQVQHDPASELAFELLTWVVMNRQVKAGARALMPFAVQAVGWLRQYHAANPTLAEACWVLGRHWACEHTPAQEFLQAVAEMNPDRAARGHATLALARCVKIRAEGLAFWDTAPPGFSATTGAQKARAACRENAQGMDAKAAWEHAAALFEAVVERYGDCPTFARTGLRQPQANLGQEAGIELFELRHLFIGQAAPEIEGEDLDGQALRLSHYRGKVVLLDFWASWCGVCMQALPHQRLLMERLQGRPFTVLGVNGDPALADARRAAEEAKATWKSFWSGPNGPNGPIPTAWNIRGWPTLYILDPKGVVRFKYLGYGGPRTDAFLDEAIDILLKETAPSSGADPASPRGGH